MSNSTSLSGGTAASNVNQDIKFAGRLGKLQRLANNHSQSFIREIPVKRLVVDLYFTGAWSQINTGGRGFAPAGSVILNFSHSNLPYSKCLLSFLSETVNLRALR